MLDGNSQTLVPLLPLVPWLGAAWEMHGLGLELEMDSAFPQLHGRFSLEARDPEAPACLLEIVC